MSGTTPRAVFLSYASQDAEAARRICEALRAAGVEVWFDQSELVGGDQWDAKIRRQIKECALFVPVISANTQARGEGYFRLEWKLAVDRSHLLADDHPFLFPVVIDDTADATARVPEKFRDVQWTRLNVKDTPETLAGRVAKLLAGEVSRRMPAGSGDSARDSSRRDKANSWLKVIVPLAGLAFGLIFTFRSAWSPAKRAGPKPAAAVSSWGGAPTPPTAVAVVPLEAAGADKSVAVLAFANLSDDKANEYFSDGISEELLNVLAKIPGLKVAARTSAFYFKDKEVPVPEIARQLGVAYVVEGSVRKSGDKVRITAQLIKAADGFHVWSDTFTRDLKDIFAVQDEIAGLIAKNLELKMGMTAARPTVDLESYQEYLTGRALFAKAGNGDLREAVGHFEKAVTLDPSFTAAWVQLASAHTQLGRWGGAPTLQAWSAARVAIDRARALEPDSPDVLLAWGWILRTADWDWRGAEQAFRRSLQLRPDHPDALAGLAVLLFNVGKKDEAFRLGQQAVRLDPLNAGTQIDLSLMFYLNDNWVEAERMARRALQLAPGGGTSYHCILAWSLIKQGRLAEAEAEVGLDSDAIEKPTTSGLLALARGQAAVAREKLAELEAISRTNSGLADLQNSIAWLGVGLGEKDRPFAALEKARDTRDPSISWLRSSPYLAPLYGDPRWNLLLHQVGLADEQLK